MAEQYADFIESTGYGTGAGLGGWNCYHQLSFYPFIPGISVRQWTDAQLDEMNGKENTPKVYKGKEYTTYEATQKQRYFETLMRSQRRKIKLLKSGGADEDGELLLGTKAAYRNTMSQYVEFSKRMGLQQQKERIYMDGLGRVG